jgi:uncharacterized membrane protein YbhN (UPF0104 family)
VRTLASLAFLRRYGRYFVSATALTFLVRYVGPGALAAAFARAAPGWLLGFLALYALAPALFGVEVWGMLRLIEVPVRWGEALVASANAWSVGVLTPARTGDLSLAYFLRGHATTGDLLAVVILDKLLSVCVLALGTLVSAHAIGFPRAASEGGAALIVVSLLLAFVASRAAAVPPGARKLARRFSGSLPAEAYRSLARLAAHPGVLAWSSAFVVARWAYLCGAVWVAFRAFGASPGPLYVVAGTMVGRLIALLPLSVGGAGLQEPVQIPIYALQGIAKEVVVAVSVLALGCAFLVSAVLPLAFPARPDVERARAGTGGDRG